MSNPPPGSDGDKPPEGDKPPAGTGTPSPLEQATPSLPARACIPWASTGVPVRATACASETVLADGTSEHARYDADSHPIEVRKFNASGELESVDTQVWRDGHQLLQRRDLPTFSPFEQTEWTYDSHGRLTRRTYTVFPDKYVNSFDYTYDAQGRLSKIVSHIGDSEDTSEYTYDAAGRLVSIDGNCGSGDTRCATLTYWPNGRVKQNSWETSAGRNSFVDHYNESGQLVSSELQYDQATGHNTRAYDSAGRLVRLRESFDGAGNTSEAFVETLTTTVYDPGGQRVRLARDRREECYDNDCGPNHDQPTWTTYTRVTHRTTVFCNTQIVALDEWDSNEDGVVDAQRTHERDSAGRLSHEAYSGTPGLDDGPVSRDFHYDCH